MHKELEMEDLLSPRERDQYVSLMIIVRNCVQSFVESGKALSVIREKRLYREKYDTFEIFCQREFQMSRSRATRLINGFHTISDLAVHGGQTPSNERVVRELNKAPKDVKRNAWDLAKKIAGNGHAPTSTTVKRAVLEVVTDGRRQRYDKEILERLRSVNRLLGMDADLSRCSSEGLDSVSVQLDKADARLRVFKVMRLKACA